MAKKNRAKIIFCNTMIVILSILGILAGIMLGLTYTDKEDKVYDIFNNIYSFLPFNTFKKTIITVENYEEINQKITDELSEEELCYFSYACIFYMTHDGFSNIFSVEQNEGIMYQRIYNKSIQQLIDEGKSLMKENNITWQEYKSTLENFENVVNGFNSEIEN